MVNDPLLTQATGAGDLTNSETFLNNVGESFPKNTAWLPTGSQENL